MIPEAMKVLSKASAREAAEYEICCICCEQRTGHFVLVCGYLLCSRCNAQITREVMAGFGMDAVKGNG